MKQFLIAVASIALFGCGASRFGHRNDQTSIYIKTKPIHLTYFLIDRDEANKVLNSGHDGLEVSRLDDFNLLLKKQLQGLVSNTGELIYTADSYIVAVVCPSRFKFMRIDARPHSKNVFEIPCQ